MDEDMLYVGGVVAETGQYGVRPQPPRSLAAAVARGADPGNLADLRVRQRQDAGSSDALAELQGTLAQTQAQLLAAMNGPQDPAQTRELLATLQRLQCELQRRQHLGTREGIDPSDLRQAGWGLILAEDADPELLTALQPLLDLRREQAGPRFQIFAAARGYRVGGRESKSKFLVRSGASAAGPVSPESVPYYLLIIGGPDKIPFEFQHQLDVQYAVGRIHFETLAEYAQYAKSVVRAERERPTRARSLTFLDVANNGDRATQLSSRQLVAPLHGLLQDCVGDWTINKLSGDDARKERVRDLLHTHAPALMFTASHGMEFAAGTSPQRAGQGALLLQDWPGPGRVGPIDPAHYLAAEDIAAGAQIHGMMLFLFACYSAGTPERDSFQSLGPPSPRATSPFLAALPMRLLSHPAGGALAVIGHIDRAWGYSFAGAGGPQRANTAAIESTLRRLLRGDRVGYAMEYLNQRYAELATVLSDELGAIRNLRKPDERALAELWAATHDARGYCLLGDPAVRLTACPAPVQLGKESPCAS